MAAAGASRPGITLMVAGLHRMLGPDPRAFVEVARVADAVGIDELLVGDHVVMGGRADRYPYGGFGYGPDDPIRPDEPWPEVLTVLAAVATATQQIRLTPGVLLAPLRHPVLLAKVVATLDQLSGGRVRLGVGTGWQREEYAALGVPWARRWDVLDDTVRACRALWGPQPASFSSATTSFEDTWCSPQPVQERLPVLLGAVLDTRRLEMAVAWGDGWIPLGLGLEEVHEGVQRLRAAFVAAGRDPDGLHVPVSVLARPAAAGGIDAGATRDAIAEAVEAGATSAWFVIAPPHGFTTLAEVTTYIEQLGALHPR